MSDLAPDDRRSSIRREVAVPFSFRRLPEGAGLGDACRALGLPDSLALQSRLGDLDEEFSRLRSVVADAAVAQALQLLDDKLSVLEEFVLSRVPAPETCTVTLSADGVGFDAGEAMAAGTVLGVHLVLPVSQHVVCLAQVTRCDRLRADAHRVGAEFRDLQGPAARRLTRFTIGYGRRPERDQEQSGEQAVAHGSGSA